MSSDLFDEFIDNYEKGLHVEALQLIIPRPDVKYESLTSKEPLLPFLINFADACVYHGALAFDHTQKVLESLIAESPKLKVLSDNFLEELKKEAWLYRFLFLSEEEIDREIELPPKIKEFFILLKQDLFHEEQINAHLTSFSERHREIFKRKLPVIKGWRALQSSRLKFSQLIETIPWAYKMPWIPYAYPLSPQPLEELLEGEIPVVFLEALQNFDYQKYLAPLRENDLILAVETTAQFFQMLQFPSIHSLINDPKIAFYILDLPPAEQLASQGFQGKSNKKIHPLLMLDRPRWNNAMSAFKEAFNHFLFDSSQSSWLHAVVKRILFNIASDRYGKSRYLSLSIESGIQSWFKDAYEKDFSADTNLGPAPTDYLGEMIEERKRARTFRSFDPKHKIRLAHVVPQIVDGGHAPSKLLNVLCTYSDPSWFVLSVISTERLIDHQLNYPVTTYSSKTSLERGKETIRNWNQRGIQVLIDDCNLNFELSVENVRIALNKLEVDIVVFHGPDEVNQLIAASCDVPIKVFYDHGTLPSHGCFDLLILSTEEAYRQDQGRFRLMGMESCYLPFSIDVRQ